LPRKRRYGDKSTTSKEGKKAYQREYMRERQRGQVKITHPKLSTMPPQEKKQLKESLTRVAEKIVDPAAARKEIQDLKREIKKLEKKIVEIKRKTRVAK
jgi:predicted RNase H-like nuclease (RuvC/YqgF family)